LKSIPCFTILGSESLDADDDPMDDDSAAFASIVTVGGDVDRDGKEAANDVDVDVEGGGDAAAEETEAADGPTSIMSLMVAPNPTLGRTLIPSRF
jgi:hypothetical protein